MPIPADDAERWNRVSLLFEQMLESDSPQVVLGQEPDASIRQAAADLWQHHLEANGEEFLDRATPFTLPPCFGDGQVLCGRFAVIRLLGIGGMGEVYLATDSKLNELVALKTISRLLAQVPGMRERFLREVYNSRRVTHTNVCRIFDVYEDGETTFYAMEYLEGESLSQALANNRISPDQARAILAQTAAGLQAAHRTGIIHGDFKPANVMVSPGDPIRAVVTDFGLARAFGQSLAPEQHSFSLRGGTAEYMAPELLAGSLPSVQSDIYAFAKVAAKLQPGNRRWTECAHPDPRQRPADMEFILRRLEHPRRRNLLAILAATAAGAGAAGYAWRNEPIALGQGARLIVNGFRGSAEAAGNLRLARSLFLTALHQSPAFRAIPDQDLLPALMGLRRGATLPVEATDRPRLMELQRASHWVEAGVVRSGARYGLDLELLRGLDGEHVTGTTLRDLPGIAQLAQEGAAWLRQKVGESPESIQANPTTVTAYTSQVPEALEKYFQGMEFYAIADTENAIPFLREAVRLDPGFAQAHNVLGMCLNTIRRHQEAFGHLERSFQLADRLPERERAWIETNYFMLSEDPVRMVEAARRNTAFYPDEPRFSRVLAHVLCRTGSARESIPYIRRAVELAPADIMNRVELVVNLGEAGRFEEALAEFNRAREEGISSHHLERGAGLAYLGLDRYEDALHAFQKMNGQYLRLTEGAKVLAGQMDSALVGLQQYLSISQNRGNLAEEHQAREFLTGTLFLLDRAVEARPHVRWMAARDTIPPNARPLEVAAFWASKLRDEEALRTAVQGLEAIAARWPNALTQTTALYGRARLASTPAEMERLLIEALGRSPSVWVLFDMAELFGNTGRPALAVEYWQKFHERRGTTLKLWFPGVLVLGWLHRANAEWQRGDLAAARAWSTRIVEHWGAGKPGLAIVQLARQVYGRTSAVRN